MANIGEYPIDATSEIGKARLGVQDTDAVNIDATNHTAEYGFFSDAELERVLALTGGKFSSRTLSYLYAYLKAQSISTSVQAQTYDLRIAAEKKAQYWGELADYWGARADDEDASAGTNESFFSVNTGKQEDDRGGRPEGLTYGTFTQWG